IRHATRRERDPASVMRPVGTCVVPGDVGELSLVRATLCHDIDVEGAYAVISSDEVTNIPITWPPPPQTGGRPEARATGLVACSSGPGGNGIEDGGAIGENGGVGQLDHHGPVRSHDENIFFVAVAGADERDWLSDGRPGGRRSRAVMGQLGHSARVYFHRVDVSVTVERDLSAIGRPGPREAVVGKHSLTAPVRVDHYDRGRATAGNPAERDLPAIRRPDGIEFVYGVVRDLGDAAAVGVHYVDIEVAVAVAVEGDPAGEAFSGGQTDLESVRLRGERSLGVLTVCEKNSKGEEGDQSTAHRPS